MKRLRASTLIHHFCPETNNVVGKGSDEALSLSPVYSLAVHRQALWLLSGTETGAINLQSVRHEEGKRITSLYKHTSAVSVLSLAADERSVLSGSWDKNIHDWDLNTGQVKRSFVGSLGQICAIEKRPESNVPIPREAPPEPTTNGTFSSNNADPEKPSDTASGLTAALNPPPGSVAEPTSPTDSLFGGNGDADSLFGDNDGSGEVTDINFGNDDDDDFSKAITSGLRQDNDSSAMDIDGGDTSMSLPQVEEATVTEAAPLLNGTATAAPSSRPASEDVERTSSGLPHSDEPRTSPTTIVDPVIQDDAPPMAEHTFLDAAIDGALRIWDRRQSAPVARMMPARGVPPWCMHACWSPDGNFIYAGRRNGTVDEYSVHKGLRRPRRSLKFPGGSGAVTAVRTMPNARHIVW